MQQYDDAPPLAQGVARPARLIPLRWARSQKLIGYLDPERGELVYQDRTGREVDRVSLSLDRSVPSSKP